jgi:hypothetical protein
MSIASEREARWNGAVFGFAQLDFFVICKLTIFEVKCVDYFVAGAAAKQARAIVREFETIKTLWQIGMRNSFAFYQVNDGHLMGAIAIVQNRDKPTTRMDRDVSREVAQFDLLAGRPERPLIWEKNGTVRLHAGKIWLKRGAPGRLIKDLDLVARRRGTTRHCQDYYHAEYECENTHKTGAHGGLKIANCKLKNANLM